MFLNLIDKCVLNEEILSLYLLRVINFLGYKYIGYIIFGRLIWVSLCI